MFQFTTLPPLALYVHFPWCVRKCPYCDFNSHEARDGVPGRGYVAALLRDLEQELPDIWGRSVETVFIGGGTPSLLSAESLDELLSGLRALLNFPATAEVTLEANPGTVEVDRFRDFRAAGVNRLSLGVQSFDDEMLRRLGRIHSGAAALAAAETALAAGFERVNLDLMYGLPGQTVAQAEADLAQALALDPGHLSHYQLTLEPNTAFFLHPPALPDDDTRWAMQETCQARLQEAGYEHYEVSAYARPGQRCRHNLNYWHFGDYVGIGAGAHGKITHLTTQTITRRAKLRHPKAYLEQAGGEGRISERRVLGRREAAFEFMLGALRLTEGFPPALFAGHCGLPLTVVGDALTEAEAKGLIEWDIHRLRPTELGQRYLDDLVGMFLPDEAPAR
ncbi:MAG TPA: oxygen-independent coproporphyrinogen III oxidase-like protein [Gammaproteobacteria bacterium]|nr:oxygen-independent coproporphyrinogen III oxidase-like protein [Gammaproteobacteria bacterium]